MIRLTELLNELEFANQSQFDIYNKQHKLRPSTKVTIAGVKTTAGLASLRRGLPDKPKGKGVFTNKSDNQKSLQNMSKDEINTTNKKIYSAISDWVISSLSDTEKRQKLAKELEAIEIPKEYKEVPSDTLYRASKKDSGLPNQRYISYSYNEAGAQRMKGWLSNIFGTDKSELEIVKRPVENSNILISIPAFLKQSKLSSGKKFDQLWKNENEVIVINDKTKK